MSLEIKEYIRLKFKKNPTICNVLINFSKNENILEKDIDFFYSLFEEKNKRNSGLIIDYKNYSSFSNLLKSFETFFKFNKDCNFFDLDMNLKELYLKNISIKYEKKDNFIIIKQSDYNTFSKLVKIFPFCWCIKQKSTFDAYKEKYGDFYIFIDDNSFYGINIKKIRNEYSCFDLENKKAKLYKFKSIRKKILGSKYLLGNISEILLLNSVPNYIAFCFFSLSLFLFPKEAHFFIFFLSLFLFLIFYLIDFDFEFDENFKLDDIAIYFFVWTFLTGFGVEFDENFPDPDLIISENPYIYYDFIFLASVNDNKYILTEKDILSDNFVDTVYEKTKFSKVSISTNQIYKYNINMDEFEKIENNKYKGLKYNIYVNNDISLEYDDRETIISIIKNQKEDINSMKDVYRLKFINEILTKFPEDNEIQELILNELFTEKEKKEFYKDKIYLKLK